MAKARWNMQLSVPRYAKQIPQSATVSEHLQLLVFADCVLKPAVLKLRPDIWPAGNLRSVSSVHNASTVCWCFGMSGGEWKYVLRH